MTKSIAHAKVAVWAKLVKPPDLKSAESRGESASASFQTGTFIKGQGLVAAETNVVTIAYGGNAEVGAEFLLLGDHYSLLGMDEPYLAWRHPVELDKTSKKYLVDLLALPAEGPKRLEFFLQHLQQDHRIVSFDVRNELGAASYSQLQSLKSRLNRNQLLALCDRPKLSVQRRQIYWLLLGICHDQRDIAYFEKILRARECDPKLALRAAITSYLALTGAKGMKLVEQRFFVDDQVEIYQTYAAIEALRIHALEGDTIAKPRAAAALRHALDQWVLADIVIMELTRLEDWSAMETLVERFQSSDENFRDARPEILFYLRRCSRPQAKRHLAQLATIDPAAANRASRIQP